MTSLTLSRVELFMAQEPEGTFRLSDTLPKPRKKIKKDYFNFCRGVNTPAGTAITVHDSATNKSPPGKGEKKAGGRRKKKDGEDKPPPPGSFKARMTALAQPKEPTFYISGANGTTLVEAALAEIGWKRITNKYDDNYKMKWVENKSAINYNNMKGEKLVNRIPNCSLLTNKLGLLNSLHRYERVGQQLSGASDARFSSRDFLPETYRIDDHAERCAFFENFRKGDLWICKPCGLNQGRGIFLVRDPGELQSALEERDEKQKASTSTRPMERIVQKYIEKPLLLDNRKFDVRVYMLIGSTTPYLVCYHPGYCRLCLYPYSQRSDNLIGHLTNQFVQKKDSSYKEYKEETVWSMERFNAYINEHYAEKKGLEKDWVYNTLTTRMKQIISYIFNAVKHKLKCKRGLFDLYGLDFMVDSNMKVYLIEVNANPCLATNCEVLKAVMPAVVRESLYLAIECFEKSKRGQPLLPLHCLTNFQMLYCGTSPSRSPVRNSLPTSSLITPRATSPYRQRSDSPRQRRSRSLSPEKEPPVAPAAGLKAPSFVPSLQMEEHFRSTARIYSAPKGRRPASTTPRIVTCPTTPTSSPHGLRGALPSLERSHTVGLLGTAQATADIFKFKMTHAALMSSIKAEQQQRKKPSKKTVLTEGADPASVTNKRTMSQSLSQDDFNITNNSKPAPTHSVSSHNLGSINADVPHPDSGRTLHSSVSSEQLSSSTITGGHFSPTRLAPRPSNGVNITASNSLTNTGRHFVFPNSNMTVRLTTGPTANSIPAVRHGQVNSTNGTVVGVALRRSERGS